MFVASWMPRAIRLIFNSSDVNFVPQGLNVSRRVENVSSGNLTKQNFVNVTKLVNTLTYSRCLTDPSYRGQIVSMTYPEIGNVWVNIEYHNCRCRSGTQSDPRPPGRDGRLCAASGLFPTHGESEPAFSSYSEGLPSS